MAAVDAEGTRKWYPFDGDCEYSVPLGRGMEYVEGKIHVYSSNSPCLGAALPTEAEHYISFCDKGHVISSLSPLLREEISVNRGNKPLTSLIRDDLLHETAEVLPHIV